MDVATLFSMLGAVGSTAALVASVGFIAVKWRAERHLVESLRQHARDLQKESKAPFDLCVVHLMALECQSPEEAPLRLREKLELEEVERELIMAAFAKLDRSDRRIVARSLDQSSGVGRVLYWKKVLGEALRGSA